MPLSLALKRRLPSGSRSRLAQSQFDHVDSTPIPINNTVIKICKINEIREYDEFMSIADRHVITRSPENSETPVDALSNWITPTESFYVRNHFDHPEVDPSGWRLAITGCVAREMHLTRSDLQQMPQSSLVATLECAGNGRSFLEGEVPGVQWGAGAVGNAEWGGVQARLLLESAGIEDGALEVVFEGADSGVEGDTEEAVRFARSLPLDMALHPDTLIALKMNGEPLAEEHGFPARLVVPGWYGVASVKWLRSLRVVDKPFRGFFQSVKYTVRRKTARGLREDVVGMMLPKSEIIRPRQGDCLAPGLRLIEGIAWAGPEAVAAVELSCDGGDSWRRAELIGPQHRYSWTRWRVEWEPSGPGEYRLLARAISASGEIQPSRHNPLHGGYHVNFSRPLDITVVASTAKKPLVFAI